MAGIPRVTADDDFVRVEIVPRSVSGDGRVVLVARFPVTVRMFGEFIDAHGYEEQKWWSPRGWSWRADQNIDRPRYWQRAGFDESEMPITGISFWEAEAYASFRQAALPTEYEWYLFSSNGGVSRYPWGREGEPPTPSHANLRFVDEFGEPTRVVPVDSTVDSGSIAGVRDLIGNVAEWCLPGDSVELKPKAHFGVLRGGASWHAPGAADVSFRDVVWLSVRDNQTGIRLIRRPSGTPAEVKQPPIGWPTNPQRLGRALKRPTRPFRQEKIPPPEELSADRWRLKVRGVPRPREFKMKDLRDHCPTLKVSGAFVCVCRWGVVNEVTGVPLREVLEKCGVPIHELLDEEYDGRRRRDLLFLKQRSVPGPEGVVYETTVRLDLALQHDALLVYQIDGEDLTPELGYPLRYVDFHLYGYKNVKCLSELIVTDSYGRGWWEERCHYDLDGTIQPGTIMLVGDEGLRVDLPSEGRVKVPPNWNRGNVK